MQPTQRLTPEQRIIILIGVKNPLITITKRVADASVKQNFKYVRVDLIATGGGVWSNPVVYSDRGVYGSIFVFYLE